MSDLKNLGINAIPWAYGIKRIRARHVVYGCKGCCFDKEEGAQHCQTKEQCMAHLRPDRTPVIFVIE